VSHWDSSDRRRTKFHAQVRRSGQTNKQRPVFVIGLSYLLVVLGVGGLDCPEGLDALA